MYDCGSGVRKCGQDIETEIYDRFNRILTDLKTVTQKNHCRYKIEIDELMPDSERLIMRVFSGNGFRSAKASEASGNQIIIALFPYKKEFHLEFDSSMRLESFGNFSSCDIEKIGRYHDKVRISGKFSEKNASAIIAAVTAGMVNKNWLSPKVRYDRNQNAYVPEYAPA